MGRDKNDGRVESPAGHVFLKSEAVHARHPDVEHDTSWLLRGGLSEVSLGRLEGAHRMPRGPKQPGQRRSHARVVVHDVDRRTPLKRGSSCAHSNLAYGWSNTLVDAYWFKVLKVSTRIEESGGPR